MVPNLNTGDIVVVAKEDLNIRSSFANLKLGEIIVFEPPSHTTPDKELAKTIVHRVVEIETDSSGARVIRTKGDANPHSNPSPGFSYNGGKLCWKGNPCRSLFGVIAHVF